ncbi:hypothetical protein VCHENC02_0889B, partial [Vibrio harveyi]
HRKEEASVSFFCACFSC